MAEYPAEEFPTGTAGPYWPATGGWYYGFEGEEKDEESP
jgi:hypothetical protein